MNIGTSLAVQQLRLHVPNARGKDSIPGQGTRSCITVGCGLKKKSTLLKILNTAECLRCTPKTQSDQIRSFAQSCLTLCDPMNRSTPGLPVHHQLPEFTQTHVHQVSDAIQPSHPLSSPSPPAPNPFQHQSLFQ